RATVHYEHYDAFEELARDVEVCTDLFVVDGPCITCCGGGASVDLAVETLRAALDVATDFGAREAAEALLAELR
ncbi:MAG: hypothetical protein AAFW88_10490, partial [Pseudomonadota bacterium]